FRVNKIAVTSDVEKAFLQIGIRPEDQDWLRYLWLKDGVLQVFKMVCVPFGLTCSPAILSQVIRKQLLKFKDKYPQTVATLLKAFYVDDCVTSLECVEQAKRLKDEAICIMKQAGLNLRKWATNSSELRNELEVKQANTQSKVL